MDLFTCKNISPMLIGASSAPFDNDAYLYEIKFDGERAVVYLDQSSTVLRNKRNKDMLSIFPEMDGIHKQVSDRCILDGEYIVLLDGQPDFSQIQRRSLMTNNFRIKLAADAHPACFVAFDILYLGSRDLTGLPLMERKELLLKTVKETERMAIARHLDTGSGLSRLSARQGVEGVVAKKRDSLYYPGKRTKDWVKIKNLLDDEFLICGWIPKQSHMVSLVLGKYDRQGGLLYKGHVTLGIGKHEFERIRECPAAEAPLFFPVPKGNEQAFWIEPELVCTVAFMERTSGGGMRQPVFKGIRADKAAADVVEHNHITAAMLSNENRIQS